MISLNQVLLLEQKVEGAVKKIQQLQSENDALRKKCAELTNALSTKTEQLSTFETDQNQIENGIKKALDRLSFIENNFLKTVDSVNQNSFNQAASVSQKTFSEQPSQNIVSQKENFSSPKKADSFAQNINFDTADYSNQSDVSTQNQTEDYENAEETSDNHNYEDNLFEERQNKTEDFAETSQEFFDNSENEQNQDDLSDENSDDDLGFDIF